MTRLDDNLEILARLEAYLLAHPDVRFSQALFNLRVVAPLLDAHGNLAGWKDTYNEEPSAVLARMDRPRGP